MFHEGDGQDRGVGFGYWKSNSGDIIQLHLDLPDDTSDEAAFESLKIRQDGHDSVIGYGEAGDAITLVGTLTIDDFDFVFVG